MDQLRVFSDNRLMRGCIYCGGPEETRDHVPSKCLLDKPYPPNLPVVWSCEDCNRSFSKDEAYFVCFIESVLSGSTKPDKFNRESVAKILQYSPALQSQIESSRREVNGKVAFEPETDRVSNVMLKLARGHAGYELSEVCRKEPRSFWWGALETLPQKYLDNFHSVHFQHIIGEIGSRNMQRLFLMTIALQSEDSQQKNIQMLVNDWIDIQDQQYRYIAIDDLGKIIIRIVISEFWGCEVVWDL